MRNRKETLLASNKEEYCQMYDEQEEQLSKRKRKFKISIKLNQDNSDDSDDQLGASSEYHLSPKKRTMTEDEEELTTKLEKINSDYKSLKNQISLKDFENNINISPTTKSTGSNRSGDNDHNYKEFFLNQNIINYDDLLKIVVIGETAVGKSLFISQLNNHTKTSFNQTNTYCPTKTFVITKTVINVNNTILGLELWDTNISILSSELIKTYYKLSNGFVIVIDYAKMIDCSFIHKQIELILSCTSSPNIFLIVNENYENRDHSTLQYRTINDQVQALGEKYFIKTMHCDLSFFDIDNMDKVFLSFIQEIQSQRHKGKVKQRQNNSKCNGNIPKRVRTADYSMDNCKNEVPIKTPCQIIRSQLNEMYDELNLGD